MYQTVLSYPYAALTSGQIPNARVVTRGNNPGVSTSAQPEDVWTGAVLGTLNGINHNIIPLAQSPTSMEIVSDSASDTSAGVGARSVQITYLDTNYLPFTVVLATNGTTPVQLASNVMRINDFRVYSTGTFGSGNVGNISIRQTGGLGATYAYLASGNGVHHTSLYTVQANMEFDALAAIAGVNRTAGSDRYATFSICVQPPTGALVRGFIISASADNTVVFAMGGIPFNVLPPKTDIWIRCETVSATNTDVTGGILGVLRPPIPGTL